MPGSPRVLLGSVLVLIAVVVALASRGIGADRRSAFLREVTLVLSAFFIYHIVRNITEGSLMHALANAYDIADLERSLGFFVEPAWQAAPVEAAISGILPSSSSPAIPRMLTLRVFGSRFSG